MDVKLCSRLWWHLIAWLYKGYSRQSFVMFSVGLSCFWVRMKLYTYVVCSLYVFQFWRSWPVLLGYTCLTSVCTVFHRGGNSRSVIFGYKNPQLSLYLDLDDHVRVLCSAQVACRNYCEPSYCGYCLRLLYMGQFCGPMVPVTDSVPGSVHTQNKGSLTAPSKQRQYPYQPEYHRVTNLSPIQHKTKIATVRRFTRIPTYDLCATQYRHVIIQFQLQR